MKNILLVFISLFLIAPALASPITLNDLHTLRIAQRELLVILDQQTESGTLSPPGLLLEVESMIKHFARVQNAVNVNNTDISKTIAVNSLNVTHQAYLKSYQERLAMKLGIDMEQNSSEMVLSH